MSVAMQNRIDRPKTRSFGRSMSKMRLDRPKTRPFEGASVSTEFGVRRLLSRECSLLVQQATGTAVAGLISGEDDQEGQKLLDELDRDGPCGDVFQIHTEHGSKTLHFHVAGTGLVFYVS